MEQCDSLDMSEMFEEAERFSSEDDGSAGGNNKNFLDKFVIMPEKEGFIVVRLLPPAKGKKFYCATRTHRLIKDEKDKKKGGRNFHCPRELVTGKGGKKFWVDTDPKNPCPHCMYARGVWSWVEAAGKESPEGKVHHAEYSRIKAIERYYLNCVVRVYDKKGNLERSEGPKILSIGKNLYEKIVRGIVGDPKAGEKGLGDVSDLVTGRDLKIVKKLRPVTYYPYYDESKFLDPSPAGDKDQVAEWLANLNDLAALRVLKSTEEMDIALQKYTGAIPDDDESSFDMSKYRKKDESHAPSLDEQVAAEKKAAAAAITAKAVKTVVNAVKAPIPTVATVTGDEVLAEGDFLAGLGSELNKVD